MSRVTTQPKVSVVTPVYNTGKYLAECIESVLAQTYQNWKYVIVDNCSSDSSLQIARSYAQRDHRIRVVTKSEVLPMVQNWNLALGEMSADSKYCKVFHADDWLFPTCLEEMVRLAEENPSVGLVGAYRLQGGGVEPQGLPYPSTLMPAQTVCRRYLYENLKAFGSPSAVMMRADLVRRPEGLYRESTLSVDAEACFEILKDSDFGFVHQVLTYSRTHADSVSSSAQRLELNRLGHAYMLSTYGPTYLSEQEYAKTLRDTLIDYYLFLCRALFRADRRDIWHYHLPGLERLGYPFSPLRFASVLLRFLLGRVFNPLRTIKGFRRTAPKGGDGEGASRGDVRRLIEL